MRHLLKAERREINRALDEMASMDLRGMSLEQVEEKIDAVEGLFGKYDVAQESEYHGRLGNFVKRAEVFFSFEEPELDFEEGRRDYVGMSGRAKIRVTCVYDHLFVSRVYGGKFKLSWRFNKEGRLDLVDSMLFPENKVFPIMKFEGFDRERNAWETRRAFYEPFPEEICFVNPGFVHLGKTKQYESLMRFGHSIARDVIENLQKSDIRKSFVVEENQKQLSKIVDDATCLHILRGAGSLLPFVTRVKNNYINVRYEKNPRCD